METHTEKAIGRLEQKVDSLVEAVTTLVRIDERQVSQNKTLDRHELWLRAHEDKIQKIRDRSSSQQANSLNNSKLIWWLFGLVGIVIGAVLKGYFA